MCAAAVLCRIYASKFANHLGYKALRSNDLHLMLDSLKGKGCSLSEKTKKDLPSYERMDTTFRNINWLLQYWMCRPPLPAEQDDEQLQWDYDACYPDPISPEFGFAMAKKKKGVLATVQWLDATATTVEDENKDD